MKYLHTNIVSKDAKKLSEFYINVFGCKLKSEGAMKGEWLDNGVNLKNANIVKSIEVTLPGYPAEAPYLEIFQYTEVIDLPQQRVSNLLGFSHISFEVEDVESTMNDVIKHGEASLVSLHLRNSSLEH